MEVFEDDPRLVELSAPQAVASVDALRPSPEAGTDVGLGESHRSIHQVLAWPPEQEAGGRGRAGGEHLQHLVADPHGDGQRLQCEPLSLLQFGTVDHVQPAP